MAGDMDRADMEEISIASAREVKVEVESLC